MNRLSITFLAGAAACALIAASPPNSHPAHADKKTEAHAKAHAAARTTVHTPASAHTEHATAHATVRHDQTEQKRATSRSAPNHEEHGVVTHTTFVHIQDDSTARFRQIARTATPVGRVRLQRSAVRTIVARRRPNLTNATFITGTIVSRQSNSIVLRTRTGSTVTVLTQAVPVAASIVTTGSSIVLPVQYVNNGLVLVPAYTVADETALANEPMLAPCAVNDNDADDAGDTSYYAPPGACSNNDGDADDGNFAVPALPNSFGPIPQVFSSTYAPAVAAGFVVTQAGSNVVLLTPDFKPLVVNAGPALSNGTTLSPGRYVVLSGYNVNNTFVATSLM